MLKNVLRLILPLAALPALSACQSGTDASPQPLSDEALAAVVKNAGVPRKQLARSIDALFADNTGGETRAVLVLRGGQIIAERYADGYDRGTRHIGWSMAKTITSVMIGMLVADGRLKLDEPVPIPAWQRPGDPRGEITLRQLLNMTAGLRHTEKADVPSDAATVRMLFLEGRDDMARYAEQQPLASSPGSQFVYSSATTVILSDLAARVLTESSDPEQRRQVLGAFLRGRVFDQIGMPGAVAEFDAAGTFIGSGMVHATAREWAQLGEFLRNNGAVKGAQLVPVSWIAFMRSGSSANPGYGGQVWLNRRNSAGYPVLWPGKAPSALFAAVGHLGQYVIVIPSAGVTIVRLGKSDEKQMDVLREKMLAVIKATQG